VGVSRPGDSDCSAVLRSPASLRMLRFLVAELLSLKAIRGSRNAFKRSTSALRDGLWPRSVEMLWVV